MMNRLCRRKGFTLLELMIVVIIIGILATLALPRFLRGVKSARWSAAASILSTIRGGQLRYYAEYSAYTTTMTDLDIDIQDSPDWTINAPAGSSAEVADISHVDTGDGFAMAEDGTITPTKANYIQ